MLVTTNKQLGVNPRPDTCKTCSWYWHPNGGKGFVPAWYPPNPKIAFFLEAPGSNEVMQRSPLVGASGNFTFHALVEPFGYGRDDVLIDNSLRCRGPNNTYPTGKVRKDAERSCRQYDNQHGDPNEGYRLVPGGIADWNPNWYIITFHPSAIINRTPAYYKLTLRAMELAFKQVELGKRPCVLFGEKAAGILFPRILGNGGVTQWQRHFWEGEWPIQKEEKGLFKLV